MDNNELEEMREQLATLNEKLEKEPIVNDAMIETAVKERLNWFQKKSKYWIIAFAIYTLVEFIFLGFYWGVMNVCIAVAFAYIYKKSKEMDSIVFNVFEYINITRKMMKSIRIMKAALWIICGLIVLTDYISIYLNSDCLNTIECVVEYIRTTFLGVLIFILTYILIQCIIPEYDIKLEFMLKDLENIEK